MWWGGDRGGGEGILVAQSGAQGIEGNLLHDSALG